ncbi:MAG: CDP-alcohol phosphatidyltransferase family protein [Ignavibacteriales bacterium]|nr:CDP-alcohol phosphatidyltransferase family protein [Ignavibacteriales bacterium]
MKINYKEIILLPNLISSFRLLLFVPFLYLFNNYSSNQNVRIYIFILIIVAFISDLLDGYVARKTNSISELGKIIDPLADKILVALIIINLYLLNEIPVFYFWIVITRDICISVGGIIVSKKIGKVLSSNLLGKLTVLSIGIFIITTLLNSNHFDIFYKLILVISCALCVTSLIGYLMRAIEMIKWNNNENISKPDS